MLLLALGAVSAVYGILQASVASDLKRLLAYSTTENVGLMFLAVGTGLLLRSVGVPGPADVAIVSCLLLVVSHAAFKSTLFLGAGSVLHATGERDLDRMGGLGARMPVTSAAFGIGALGAAALPVTAGFVAEWALLQSLIHGARPDNRLVAVAMPVAVAVVALTAGLALMTFVKAYGIAFLARPRSAGATDAHEATRSMQAAMLLAGALVLGLGLVPGLVAEAAARAAGVSGVGSGGWFGVDLPGVERGPRPGRPLARRGGDRGPGRVVSVARGPASASASGRAGVGRRRGPGEPADAVHRDVVRRAPCPGLRRRAASRARHRDHPRQRVQVPRRAGAVPAASRRRGRGQSLPADA